MLITKWTVETTLWRDCLVRVCNCDIYRIFLQICSTLIVYIYRNARKPSLFSVSMSTTVSGEWNSSGHICYMYIVVVQNHLHLFLEILHCHSMFTDVGNSCWYLCLQFLNCVDNFFVSEKSIFKNPHKIQCHVLRFGEYDSQDQLIRNV
jgi:hypothetical protein